MLYYETIDEEIMKNHHVVHVLISWDQIHENLNRKPWNPQEIVSFFF